MSLLAGLFPAAVLRVTGKDRVDLLHRLSTNDLQQLAKPLHATTTVLANEKGRIVDWVLVQSLPDALLLRASHGRAPALAAWLDRFIIMEDVKLEDVSSRYTLALAHGPGARALVAEPPAAGATSQDGAWVTGLEAYGERYEGLLPTAAAPAWLDAALQHGASRADEITLETLRLRAGVPSPDHEFKEEVNPLELRINRGVISWTKGCYIGQEVIARLDSYDKLQRQLIGFEHAGTLPAGEAKLMRGDKSLGRVTSSLSRPDGSLGLAVVKLEAAVPGEAELVTEAGRVMVRLVDRPFWQ